MSQANTWSVGCNRRGEDEQNASWEKDKLDRKPHADRLTALIQNTRGPYVIGLTSPWGSGKTFFLRAWERDLVEQKKPCVYFNAWKSDITDDPLLSLMATIDEQLTEKGFILPKNYHLLSRVIDVLPFIGKVGGRLMTTSGNPVVGVCVEAGGQLVKYAKSKIANNIKFQEQLEELAKSITEIFEGFPLFIMVDELDRCRPEYAITLLERIKHLFQVPGVVFLLAIDATQLLLQVEHTFGLKKDPWTVEKNQGESIDPRIDYLGKFFDMYYSLPSPNIQKFVKMHLDDMAEFTSYNHLCNGICALEFSEILTGDPNLFEGKSLRLLLQDLSFLSILLKVYRNLCFEEIFTAFYIIIRSKNKLFGIQSIENELKNETLDTIKKAEIIYSKFNILSDIQNEHVDKQLRGMLFSEKAFCANLFIRFTLVIDREHMFSAFESEMGGCCAGGYAFWPIGGTRGLTRGARLKSVGEVERILQPKLKLLDDFSATLS